MTKIVFFLNLILCFCSCAHSQDIKWQENRKLSWSDFTIVEDTVNVGHYDWYTAVTQTYFSHTLQPIEKHKISIDLKTFFSKKLSMVKR